MAEEKKEVCRSCNFQKKCGGCQYQGMAYEEQLERKHRLVKRLIGPFCPVEPVAGMYYPYYYRNKVHRVFGLDKKGHPIYGIYKQGTHDIIQVKDCLIEDRQCQKIIDTIWSLLPSFKIRTYDEDSDRGFLRHVIVRRAVATGQVMVVLVTAEITWPGAKNFVKVLREKHPEITTIVQNVNPKRTTFLLGDRNKVLYGPGKIIDRLMGLSFAISPASFYQVNPKQTEVLYRLAIEAANLQPGERVLDAYCGIGTIGMSAAAVTKNPVIGVELNPDAVRDAIGNAKANQLKNIRFVCADATEWMEQAAAAGEKIDVVFLDPPRSGSTDSFIRSLAKLAPKRVVYISCGVDTLARDLKTFRKQGYEAVRDWPVDMFPGTEGHIENVVLLEQE